MLLVFDCTSPLKYLFKIIQHIQYTLSEDILGKCLLNKQLLLSYQYNDVVTAAGHIQLNLDYPDLDYPDYSIIRTFFSGPNFFMNIN